MESVTKLVKNILEISEQIYNLYQKLADIEKNGVEKNIVKYKKNLEFVELCIELEDKYYLKLNNYDYNEICNCFYKELKYSKINSQTKTYINERFLIKLKRENCKQNKVSDFIDSLVSLLNNENYDAENEMFQKVFEAINIMFINRKINTIIYNDDLKNKMIEHKYNCMYFSNINPIYSYEPIFLCKIKSVPLSNEINKDILELIDDILSKKHNEYELTILLCYLKTYLYILNSSRLEILVKYYENQIKSKNTNNSLIQNIDECIEDIVQKRKNLKND